MSDNDRETCLGPDGSAARVSEVVRMIRGRWKLPILFRLYAVPAMRTSALLHDLPRVSQKMLTQHLRELVAAGLVERICVAARPLHVEYRLTSAGRQLLLALRAMRDFSVGHARRGATGPEEEMISVEVDGEGGPISGS